MRRPRAGGADGEPEPVDEPLARHRRGAPRAARRLEDPAFEADELVLGGGVAQPNARHRAPQATLLRPLAPPRRAQVLRAIRASEAADRVEGHAPDRRARIVEEREDRRRVPGHRPDRTRREGVRAEPRRAGESAAIEPVGVAEEAVAQGHGPRVSRGSNICPLVFHNPSGRTAATAPPSADPEGLSTGMGSGTNQRCTCRKFSLDRLFHRD
jgi:hypothetical protein